MHPVYRITHIGRPIEPRYKTNLAILIVMAVALVGGAVWSLVQSAGVSGTVWGALSAALTVFLSWALGRELAPDDDAAAFAGVALALGAWIFLGKPDLILLAGSLGCARIVNRTVGPPAKLGDSIAVLLAATLLALLADQTAILVAAALAFLLDSALPPARRLHRIFGALALVALGGTLVLSRGWRFGGMPIWALAIGTLVFVAVIATCGQPQSRGDIDGEPLERRRIQSGMVVVLAAAVWASLSTDEIAAVGAIWATLAGTSVGRAVELVRGRPA